MKKLDEASLRAFLGRFYDFYDGVVRQVTLHFEAKPPTCEVVVDVQDAESESGWSRVVLRVDGCSGFRLEAGRTTFAVLSSGIQVGWEESLVFLFLDAYPDDEGLPDIMTNRGYVVGDALHWSATPVSTDR